MAANGLSKAWSAILLYSGGSGFINTGFIGVELYHIDCNNFLTQEGVTRQFDENILPFTSLRRVGSDRIIDESWHHYCMRIKLNTLRKSTHGWDSLFSNRMRSIVNL